MAAPLPAPSGDSKKIYFEIIAWFFILWLLWFNSGGPSRVEESSSPFLKPPSPLNTGEVYGDLSIPILTNDTKKNLRVSVGGQSYSDVRLSMSQDRNNGEEFIEISVLSTSKNPINISGWIFDGVVGEGLRTIGKGAELFYQGKVNAEKDIILYPGQKALILPGNSPVGVSFMMNKCIGYLEQFQVFIPHLPQSCPQPILDGLMGVDTSAETSDSRCNQFLRSIPRCNAYVRAFPDDISNSCRQIVNSRLNYNSCVSENINDQDFIKGEWRVYLGGPDSFGSKNGDIISIYNANGALIDTIFYNK